MNHHYQHKQPGQSFPILAAMLLVIVALVGLSVDVGNAYGQERRVQNVSNAGALAAMNSVVANQSNNDVCTNVQRTLAANRVGSDAPNFKYRVDYVYSNGEVQFLCDWNGSTLQFSPELNMNATRPQNIVRAQVTMSEVVDTYFAKVVGRDTFTVNGNGNACLGNYGQGVYPVGIPRNLLKSYHTIYRSNGAELSTSSLDWGQWDKMVGMQIRLPVENWEASNPGTHISWFDWSAGASSASELDAAMTFPGTLQNGFTEAASPDSSKPNTAPLGKLGPGDWVEGKTGTVASISDELAALMQIPGVSPAQARDLILPMYTEATGNGSSIKFYVQGMGRFRVTGYELTGNPKYLQFQYLGEASANPEECASETVSDPKRFNIAGTTKVNRVWRTNSSSSTTFDIVVVLDESYSMWFDWEGRRQDRNDPKYKSENARIHDARKAIVGFLQSYDIAADPDARISFVTFAGKDRGNTARVEVDWTKACANPATGCGGSTNQWKTIQDQVMSIQPDHNTPGPAGMEVAEQQLRNKRTPPAGKQYQQIVLFATDGVFNICGKDVGQENCPVGQQTPCDGNSRQEKEYCLGNPQYNMVNGRPIWQAQQVANRIKAGGARLFMITISPKCTEELKKANDCFDTSGLPDMSSGTGYYYDANDPQVLMGVYGKIKQQITDTRCLPMEKTELAEGAQMTLTMPSNPTFVKTVIADSDGKWNFTGLEAGEYSVKVNPSYSVRSPEDGKSRTYVRLRNGLNLSEETKASVYLNPQFANGSTVYSEVLLSLPLGTDRTPLNGCTTP